MLQRKIAVKAELARGGFLFAGIARHERDRKMSIRHLYTFRSLRRAIRRMGFADQ
jgi:hypothetical protein